MRMARLFGSLMLTITGFAVLTLLISFVQTIDPSEISEYLPRIWKGFLLTILIATTSFGLGFVVATFLVLASFDRYRTYRCVSVYQSTFRFTPLLAQVYLIYYGTGELVGTLEFLGIWWLLSDPYFCVMLIFVLNSAAYQSFIMMGCINNLPRSQYEASKALGLPKYVILAKVLLPQALRVAIKPLGNELIGMIKASSVASVVTIYDLLGETQSIYAETFNLGYFFVAAILYIALVEITRISVSWFSVRLSVPTS